MNTRDTQAPEAEVRRTPYDRHRWEAEVMASDLGVPSRLVAFVLAHYSGPGGYLREDGIQNSSRLSLRASLTYHSVKDALRTLEREQFIWRPSVAQAHTRKARPITLTMPPARARGELPSTGEVPE